MIDWDILVILDRSGSMKTPERTTKAACGRLSRISRRWLVTCASRSCSSIARTRARSYDRAPISAVDRIELVRVAAPAARRHRSGRASSTQQSQTPAARRW